MVLFLITKEECVKRVLKKKWTFLLVFLFVFASGYLYIANNREGKLESAKSLPDDSASKEKRTLLQRDVVSSDIPEREISSTKKLEYVKEDFKELKSFSDSRGKYFISKTYGAVMANDFDNAWPYLAKLQKYYIVEKENGRIPVAYEENSGRMGVLTGSIMIKVGSKERFESVQRELMGESLWELGHVFAHIDVLHINVREKQKIWEVVEKLSVDDNLSRIEVEFFSEILRPM